MKISVIFIINNKDDFRHELDNFGVLLKNERYEIILVNNLLNFKLDKYYESDKEHIKIINLSKSYGYMDSLLAGMMNASGNLIVSVNSSYAFNVKDLMIDIESVKSCKFDQIIYYNETEKKLFKDSKLMIGSYIFNKEVKEGLISLYNRNIKININEIGFVTNKIIDSRINFNNVDDNGYYLIRNKIGFEESIL